MTKPNGQLRADVEQLLKKSVAEEATAKVWERFEQALSQLDENSQAIFSDFLSGHNYETLAKQRGLKRTEVEEWIKQIRRQINEALRQTCKVRQ